MLNVIDEFTREALAIAVDRCIDTDSVVAVLDRFNSAASLFIDPGSP